MQTSFFSLLPLLAFISCSTPADDLFGPRRAADAGVSDAASDGDAEAVDAADTACDADAGQKACTPGDPAIEQVCATEDGGTGQWTTQPCPEKHFCQDGAGCVPCPMICVEGAISCSADARDVLECKTSATGCTDWVPVLNCPTEGMASCELPPQGFPVGGFKDYCVNECGGRGMPLSAKQCDPDPMLPCGVLVCNVNTHQLEPDHSACLGGGLACQNDSDCLSCNCTGAKCIGDTEASCSVSCK